MVVASVTVHVWAGVVASPVRNLGLPGAVFNEGGGRGGFMAAGCPDSELFLWRSS